MTPRPMASVSVIRMGSHDAGGSPGPRPDRGVRVAKIPTGVKPAALTGDAD